MSVGRSTTTRDRHRKAIRYHRPPCGICSEPIDYSLPYMDPGEFVVDHVIPLSRGGLDVIENKQAAHRSCNATKSNKLEGDALPKRIDPLATSRAW